MLLPRRSARLLPQRPTCVGAAADAQVVVGELNAVQAALGAAGVGQALVDVPLAPLSSKAGQAAAAVAPDLVHALTPVEAVGPPGTVINVLFTKQAWGEGRGERELGPFWEPCSPVRKAPSGCHFQVNPFLFIRGGTSQVTQGKVHS